MTAEALKLPGDRELLRTFLGKLIAEGRYHDAETVIEDRQLAVRPPVKSKQRGDR